MKKIITTISLLSMILLQLYAAVGVSKEELEAAVTNPDVIEFINYSGPHSRIDTKEQILNIGRELGKVVAENKGTRIVTGNEAKYSLIHAVYSDESTGLDADILILGNNAEVDHIKNLRLIIKGYLMEAYDYSDKDATTLATFITVYNAVYKGRISSILTKYKISVLAELNADKFGLSVNWADWAGNTEIIIPLLDPEAGGLSTIDTTIISDTNVIAQMRDEDDRMVEDRRNMVDLKEREALAAEEDAQDAMREAVAARRAAEEAAKQAEEARIEAEKAAAEAEQALKDAQEAMKAAQEAAKQAEEKQKEAETAVKEAQAKPQEPAVQKVAEEKKEEAKKAEVKAEETKQEAVKAEKVVEEKTIIAEEKKAEAEEKQEEAVEKKVEAEEKKEEASEKQEFADKKRTEAIVERTAIANDQQKNISDAIRAAKIVTTYGLKVSGTDSMYSSIVLIDISNGNVVKESPVTEILNRTILPVEDGFAAIAGRESEAENDNKAVKLVILDDVDMEITKQTVETVSSKSVLIEKDGLFYVVISEDGGFYLARYDSDLNLVQKSDARVYETTPVIITDTGIAVTAENGNVVLLDNETLKLLW